MSIFKPRDFVPLSFVSLAFSLCPTPILPCPAAPVVSGSYVRADSSTLDVRALSGGRVTFHLVALGGGVKNAPNLGEARGEIRVKHGRATYLGTDYRLTMTFAGGKIFVTQSRGTSDFGMGVRADGVYLRRKK